MIRIRNAERVQGANREGTDQDSGFLLASLRLPAPNKQPDVQGNHSTDPKYCMPREQWYCTSAS